MPSADRVDEPAHDRRSPRIGREERLDRKLGDGDVDGGPEDRPGADERQLIAVVPESERHRDVAEGGVERRPRLAGGIGLELLAQHRQRGIAGRDRVARESVEEMLAPLVEVEDPRGHSLRMQAEPKHIHRRLQEVLRDAADEHCERAVAGDEAPVAIDDERRVRVMAPEHLVDRIAHGAELRRIERALREPRREARGEQQCVPVAQRHVELLCEVENHLRARTRAAGLDEAEMARGDTGLERKLELAETPSLSPLPQHRRDGRAARGRVHDADRSPHGTRIPLPPRSCTRARFTGTFSGQVEQEETMEAAQLVERYLDTWNETDPQDRYEALAEVWTADASYVDPLTMVEGRDQIDAMIGAVQQLAPGHVFRLLDGVDAHHNVVRFRWELVPASGGEPVAVGFDVAETDDDGRIACVVGFLDMAPAA